MASSQFSEINALENDKEFKKLIADYTELFDGTLGTINGIEASVTMANAPSLQVKKFWPPRRIPYAIEKRVDMELQRLEARGIIERVPNDISEYASPIVVVAKRGSDALRICGDFKVSVNKLIEVEQYPLPRAEQIFAKLGKATIFSTLDLTEAYHQVKLDEKAKKLLVINTPRGLYRYLRLPFGISSAPAIFQRTMDWVLRDIPGIVVYLDDVLVASKTEEEHMERLRQVFERFRQIGIRLGLKKCSFGQSSVQYLGHKIDRSGLHAVDTKLEAIQKAPDPTNITELKSFLGLITYYGKFIENQATICSPFYELLKKDVQFKWGQRQQNAMIEIKKILSSPPVLTHYDPEQAIGLATDASQYGVGAVLYHIYRDGTEKPISYASCTLNVSQRNYSQIEKEAYSIIFGLSKFKPYLYGRRFQLVTDHKPLLALFGTDKAIP